MQELILNTLLLADEYSQVSSSTERESTVDEYCIIVGRSSIFFDRKLGIYLPYLS